MHNKFCDIYDLRDNLVSFGKSPNSWWNDVQKSTLQTDLEKAHAL